MTYRRSPSTVGVLRDPGRSTAPALPISFDQTLLPCMSSAWTYSTSPASPVVKILPPASETLP
jgi:hypothetical protein